MIPQVVTRKEYNRMLKEKTAVISNLLTVLEKAKAAVDWMADATDSDSEDRELLELVNKAIECGEKTKCDNCADLLKTLELSLEWLDNLFKAHNSRIIVDSMPNDWNGRIGMREVIAKAKEN